MAEMISHTGEVGRFALAEPPTPPPPAPIRFSATPRSYRPQSGLTAYLGAVAVHIVGAARFIWIQGGSGNQPRKRGQAPGGKRP